MIRAAPCAIWAGATPLVLGAGLLALAAQATIPLPATAVPLTLQSLAVLIVGGVLGPRRGALSLCLYLCLGGLGAPVFSGASGGPDVLFGPHMGYLAGFPLAAFLAGHFSRHTSSVWRLALLLFLATVPMLLLGAAWLERSGALAWNAAWNKGIEPLLPGAALKALIAAGLISAWRRRPTVLRRARRPWRAQSKSSPRDR